MFRMYFSSSQGRFAELLPLFGSCPLSMVGLLMCFISTRIDYWPQRGLMTLPGPAPLALILGPASSALQHGLGKLIWALALGYLFGSPLA